MNERQFRKRTDEESRARMDARRAEKDAQRRQKAGKVVWHSPSQGTLNEGRNAAKRARRARQFGSVWVNPRAGCQRPTKPVRPVVNARRRAMTAKRREAAKRNQATP
jgi:hypothetical protein